MSCTLYAVLFFCAPLIADFYGQPKLVGLSRLVFASFVMAGIGTAHAAYMFRNMMNKGKAILGSVASVTSGLTGRSKSTRLNSSHANISYAVFCLKQHTRPHTQI